MKNNGILIRYVKKLFYSERPGSPSDEEDSEIEESEEEEAPRKKKKDKKGKQAEKKKKQKKPHRKLSTSSKEACRRRSSNSSKGRQPSFAEVARASGNREFVAFDFESDTDDRRLSFSSFNGSGSLQPSDNACRTSCLRMGTSVP